MKSSMIREKFFNYFTSQGHTLIPSSSLIPAQDPTLLFANAGMNQFKDVFLGKEKRSYNRAVSIQKCIRAGGKHNDLENVGLTKRHLTFFEMMGNFSFGDYFKKEAITFAWNFLTKDMGLPQEKLYASVFHEDDESYDIWHKEMGLDAKHVVRLGAADNFWQMGDTGPCGPCTEIYLDRGIENGCQNTSCAPGCSCDRFLEIWNLVFMQYNRQSDGKDIELSQKGVDTGMGLERLAAVMQNKDSVFDTDIFAQIIAITEKLTGHSYHESPEITTAFRVLADHIRSSSFAIADGGTPSNEGRGYVLRKIIRRAAMFAQKLSNKNFFPELVEPLCTTMGEYYPELLAQKNTIKKLLENEIDRFTHNLIGGKAIFSKYAEEAEKNKLTVLSGAQAFKLYDTFGFPLELTNVLALERGLSVNIEEFNQEMEKQRAQSGKKATIAEINLDPSIATEFVGYDELITQSTINGLLEDGKSLDHVSMGQTVLVITNKSPFFVECGGQISDKGIAHINGKPHEIAGLRKIDNAIAFEIKALTDFSLGSTIELSVDKEYRINIMKNHTATHLLQAALIEMLGKTVRQSGSLVAPDYLRFDFTHHENLTTDQIKHIEDVINDKIRENISLDIFTTTYKKAIDKGVIAIFGEKYNPENVRVIDIPGFSKELCGGTHVPRTGDIGCFKITEVTALSAGNRRIIAVTGPKAIEVFQDTFGTTKALGQELKVKVPEIPEAIKKIRDNLKLAQTQIRELKKKMWAMSKDEWLKSLTTINGIPFVSLTIKDGTPEELREIAQELLTTQDGLYFLVAQTTDKSYFYITVSPSLADKINLSNAMSWLKSQKLGGGGSKTALQGSGVYIDQKLINAFKDWLKQ